jgi:hypothetical protein
MTIPSVAGRVEAPISLRLSLHEVAEIIKHRAARTAYPIRGFMLVISSSDRQLFLQNHAALFLVFVVIFLSVFLFA